MGSKWKVVVPVAAVVVIAVALVLVVAPTGTDDTPSSDVGTIEITPNSDTAAPENGGAETAGARAGNYEISAQVAGQCGTYDVFLLARLSSDGKVTLDKLFNPGGQVFESAKGLWDPQMAVAIFTDENLFDAWVLRFDRPGMLSVYNVYGPSSPVVSAGTELDLADFAGVDSAVKLDEVTAGGVDACVTDVSGIKVSFAPLP